MTGLYDQLKGRTPKPVDAKNVELFLDAFEKKMGHELRSQVLDKDKRELSDLDKDLIKIIKELKKSKDWMLIPTDKTKKWLPIQISAYAKMMR